MGTDYTEKMQRYMEALEEERRKILVFQRELPFCLELVTQAIGACKQQLSATGVAECKDNGNGQSECSEQTSTEGTPVLEEFIPMKRPSRSEDDEDDEEEQHSHKQTKMDKESNWSRENSTSADSKKKSDWLKSAQLWNQTPDPPAKEEHQPPRKVSVVEVTRSCGAFQPFNRDQNGSAKSHPSSEKPHSLPLAAATSSTTENAPGGRKEEKEGQTQTQTLAQRKQRRCWSPELHRRFLQALQQLGGSHAATPKQIRELMKVDGLTNDEVKSHLQKFRLHTRRPSPPIHSSSSSSSQPPQIVVVGGIWVPPPEYAAVASTDAAKAAATGRIYAPVAVPATPPPLVTTAPEANSTQNPQSEEGRRSGHSSHSNSSPSSTSSSSHTNTASPLY